jgi:hypothetical protein
MKETKNKRGAPTKPANLKRDKRLGVIQLTQDELNNYEDAAELEGKTKSDWVRDTLNAKVKITMKNKQ